MENLLEPRLYFRVKGIVAVFGRMFTSMGVGLEALADGFIGANTFENAPWLMQRSGCSDHIRDLVAA